MAKYLHNLQIKMSAPGVPFDKVEGNVKISTSSDGFCMEPGSLSFTYERARRQSQEQALNPTRIKRIEELWLLYYALTGRFPVVELIQFDNGREVSSVPGTQADLPNAPECSMPPLIEGGDAGAIYASNNRKKVLSCISYLWAAQQVQQEIARFRLLWSAFNCLYKGFSGDSAEYLDAHGLLNAMEQAGVLEEEKMRFRDVPPPDSASWRWNDFLKGFRALRADGKGKPRPNTVAVLADADSGVIKALMKRSAYRNWESLDSDSNEILRRCRETESGSKGNRFLFVLAYYLYWYRCDTVHGNSPYPVFIEEGERSLLESLSDILQGAIAKGMVFVARHGGSHGLNIGV